MILYKYLHEEVEIDDKLCFVIMPFAKDMEPVFNDGIRPAVEALGLKCERADQQGESIPIMLKVYGQIRIAKIVISDITAANPNVYYELGLCHALKPQVITIKLEGDKTPFDLEQVQAIEYNISPQGLSQLQHKLKEAISNLLNNPDMFGVGYEAELRQLKKAYSVWKISNAVILGFEQFLQIAFAIDRIIISDDEEAFMAFAAAYFGKFMKSIAVKANKNVSAIRTLVKEVATGAMTRVPWRAAAILEYCDDDIVRAEIEGYAGTVLNDNIFPDAILNKKTLKVLKETISAESMSRELTDKLAEVVRQIESEFQSIGT